MEVKLSEGLKKNFPDLKVGILGVRNVTNKSFDSGLEQEKRRLEDFIRKNYLHIEDFEVIKSYNCFFKRFGKTYPIQFQIESIIKGKRIPARLAIVEAMFMAELKNMYLTAGHDLNALQGNLETKLTKGGERYVKINGQEQELKAGDIFTSDALGIISSVLYGPDHRTRITENTRNLLFFSYFPYGEDDAKIKQHLQNIVENLKIFSSELKLGEIKVFQL